MNQYKPGLEHNVANASSKGAGGLNSVKIVHIKRGKNSC